MAPKLHIDFETRSAVDITKPIASQGTILVIAESAADLGTAAHMLIEEDVIGPDFIGRFPNGDMFVVDFKLGSDFPDDGNRQLDMYRAAMLQDFARATVPERPANDWEQRLRKRRR